ncbi:hypothetical protein Pen01_55980 [Phytomonospora endophytica]|nr:hypothetical protein Pen01_55980 [Phytomonospora endophytica]
MLMLIAGADLCAAHPHHPDPGHGVSGVVHCEPLGHRHHVERFDADPATAPVPNAVAVKSATVAPSRAVVDVVSAPTTRAPWTSGGADGLIGLCVSRT